MKPIKGFFCCSWCTPDIRECPMLSGHLSSPWLSKESCQTRARNSPFVIWSRRLYAALQEEETFEPSATWWGDRTVRGQPSSLQSQEAGWYVWNLPASAFIPRLWTHCWFSMISSHVTSIKSWSNNIKTTYQEDQYNISIKWGRCQCDFVLCLNILSVCVCVGCNRYA